MHIRTAGVQFMRDNPERFIESNSSSIEHGGTSTDLKHWIFVLVFCARN